MIRCPRALRAALGVAAAACLTHVGASTTHANVTDAQWGSSTQFNYRIVYVPDFDQRRNNLPSNGSNYCVPTSFMNWSAYIARRGNPSQPPGPPPWGFNEISTNLIVLGILQGTDPNGGTGPSGGASGGGAWLSGRAFVWAITGNTSAGFPRLSTLASQAINSNALIIPRVGWYDVSDFPFIDRNGGHAVSMVRAARSGSSQLIGIHDPAWTPSGDTLAVQSSFIRNEYAVQDIVVFPNGNAPALMSRINGYGSGNTNGYIYGNYMILPYVALAPIPNGFSLRLWRINFANPGMADEDLIPAPFGWRIRQGMMGMNPTQIMHVAEMIDENTVGLFCYDTVEKAHTPLAQVDGPLNGIATSRFDRVYMLAGGTIYCANPNQPDQDYVEATMNVDPILSAIAYDDLNDQVVLLQSRTRQLVRYPADLPAGVPPILQDIPVGVPMNRTGNIDVRPGDGSVLIATEASTAAYLLLPAIQANADRGEDVFDVEVISIPGANGPITGGSFTDTGVLLTADGVSYEMMKDENDRWVLVEDSPFNGLPMEGPVYAARSRTDVDRDTEMDPENADTLPDDFSGNEAFVECPADLNADGLVNFADLNLVLTSYGQTGAGLPGDVNGDEVVNFDDLNTVLTFFGRDCLN
ncbi:MAG: hypothetical protein ACTS27_03520 [Phycisphaerales bacterium]